MEDLDLVETSGTTRIRLRVTAGARSTTIRGVHGGALKVGVAVAPERGRANRAVLDLVAGALGVPVASLELVSGATSRDKTVSVKLDAGRVRARLSRRIR